MSKRLTDLAGGSYGESALLGAALTAGCVVVMGGVEWAKERVEVMFCNGGESEVHNGPPKGNRKKKIKKRKKAKKS